MKKILFILLFPLSVFANGQTLIFGVFTDGIPHFDINAFGWYRPESYGAVGDGTTNDAAAFNSMIAAMPSTGGVIYLSEKDYRLSAKWTIDKPVRIIGAGMGASFISTASGTLELIDVTSVNVSMESFTIINKVSSGYTVAATAGYAMQLQDATFFNMENVKIIGFYDQIDIEAAAFATINRSYFLSFGHYGLYVKNTTEADVGDIGVTDCNFTTWLYTGAAAIRHESSGGLRITSCKGNWSGGSIRMPYFYDGLINGSTVDLLITGCSIENFTGRGIRINTTGGATFSQIVITGNQIASYTSATYAIEVKNVSGVSIKGNTMAYGVNGIYHENVTTLETDNVFWNNSGTEVTAGP